MVDLGYDGHYGSSFGLTMRNMRFIALHGLEEHKKIWLNNKYFSEKITFLFSYR